MMAAGRTEQPRALAPLKIGEEETLKSPMELELWKLGMAPARQRKARQLLLGEEPEENVDRIIAQMARHLDFSTAELRCIHALQVLFHQAGYQGASEMPAWDMGRPGGQKHPALRVKPIDLARLMLGKAPGARITGKAWEDARDGLEGLTEPRWVVYGQTYFKKGQKMVKAIRTKEPLVRVFEAHGEREATAENIAELLAPGSQAQQAKELLIALGPLLFERIHEFHTRKPLDLYDQAQKILSQDGSGRRRISAAVLLFLDYLYTKNTPTLRVSEDYLAETLRLDGYIRQRKRQMVRTRIDECLSVATEMGLIKKHHRNRMGLLTIELNPDRFSRILEGGDAEEEEEEEAA